MRSRLFLFLEKSYFSAYGVSIVSYAVLYQHPWGSGRAMDCLIEFFQLIHGSAKLRSAHSLGLLSCGSQRGNGFHMCCFGADAVKGVLCTRRYLTPLSRKQPDGWPCTDLTAMLSKCTRIRTNQLSITATAGVWQYALDSNQASGRCRCKNAVEFVLMLIT